jgi:secretion/DNA translocation related CpaE-like protein
MDRILVITSDPTLLDELVRLAAAAGCACEHAPDLAAALRWWGRAAVVLVGGDQLEGLATLGPPRREGVHAVCWGTPADGVFRHALAIGAESVVELPRGVEAVGELLTDLGEGADGPGLVVGVLGGAGGAGATVFAAALAQLAAPPWRVAAIDADPLGPGLDRVLGLEELEGVRWDELAATNGRLGARSLREALPRRDGPAVLTWARGVAVPPPPEVVRSVVSAARRGHDLVVVDLPRVPSVAGEELTARCDLVLVVVPTTVSAVASASRVIDRLPDRDRVSVVLRGLAMDPAVAARVLDAPVIAQMADQRGLDEAIDLGLGPVRSRRGALGRAAVRVLERCLVQAAVA